MRCIDRQQTEKPLVPTVAKNLLCADDEKPLGALRADSDLSFPETSVSECHLEKQLVDLDKGVKDLSFEEPKAEDLLTMSPNCQEASRNGVEADVVQNCTMLCCEQDNHQKHTEETDTISSPSEKMTETVHLFRKNNVVFRSYNSPINVSNVSDPCSMASLDIMDLSPACSGSYPTAITPLQKGRPYRAYQVYKGTWDLCVGHC